MTDDMMAGQANGGEEVQPSEIRELNLFSKNRASDSMYDFTPKAEGQVDAGPKAQSSATESAEPLKSKTPQVPELPVSLAHPARVVKENSSATTQQTPTSSNQT